MGEKGMIGDGRRGSRDLARRVLVWLIIFIFNLLQYFSDTRLPQKKSHKDKAEAYASGTAENFPFRGR